MDSSYYLLLPESVSVFSFLSQQPGSSYIRRVKASYVANGESMYILAMVPAGDDSMFLLTFCDYVCNDIDFFDVGPLSADAEEMLLDAEEFALRGRLHEA